MAVSRQRETKVRKTAWNLPTCAAVLPPAWAQRCGWQLRSPETRLGGWAGSSPPGRGSESVTQEPWSSLQPVHLWRTCCLFALCPSASLPAGYWTTLKELPDGPVMYHDYVFYLKLTYFSCIFISLAFIPHSGFSCHGSFIFPWDKEEFEYRLMYTSQVYRNPYLLKEIS